MPDPLGHEGTEIAVRPATERPRLQKPRGRIERPYTANLDGAWTSAMPVQIFLTYLDETGPNIEPWHRREDSNPQPTG